MLPDWLFSFKKSAITINEKCERHCPKHMFCNKYNLISVAVVTCALFPKLH